MFWVIVTVAIAGYFTWANFRATGSLLGNLFWSLPGVGAVIMTIGLYVSGSASLNVMLPIVMALPGALIYWTRRYFWKTKMARVYGVELSD